MKPDERKLLDDVLAGRPGAFDAFLQRYRSLFFSVLYGKGFKFPNDYIEDVYQSFVVALAANDYHRLRAYQGRNNCSLATYLQIVVTRFALDELRRWKRHPRARGMVATTQDEEFVAEIEDPRATTPLENSLEGERMDLFHNLLFALDWKRISSVLWVFRGVARERVAEMMDTSRANIDALYKRAKDQMTQRFAEGSYSRRPRQADPEVLTDDIRAALRELLPIPTAQLHEALLQPGAKRRALVGLILLNYAEYRVSGPEMARLAGNQDATRLCLSVLDELTSRVGP